MQTIFLVGFMGSGKTYWGKKISGALRWDFFDTDAQIEKLSGKSINDLFLTGGEGKFREVEQYVLRNLPLKEKNIVSCGGGTPCFSDNMEWMKKNGRVIYLRVGKEILLSRLLKNKNNKPLLFSKTDEEVTAYVDEALQTRMPYYLQADYALEVDENAQQEDITEILKKIIIESTKINPGD